MKSTQEKLWAVEKELKDAKNQFEFYKANMSLKARALLIEVDKMDVYRKHLEMKVLELKELLAEAMLVSDGG